jgi:phosphoribosylformylglycinamidine cyclo-ligase
MSLDGHVEEFGRTLGDELLEPTRIYARDCLAVAAETDVRTFAHVTGGGLCANLARVLPTGLTAELDRTTWTPAPVFKLIASRGRVTRDEMERTFNMGVGMIAVLPPDDVDRAMAVLTAKHVPSWVIGEVRATTEADDPAPDSGHALLRGDHPRF